jgi:hypothetical protein
MSEELKQDKVLLGVASQNGAFLDKNLPGVGESLNQSDLQLRSTLNTVKEDVADAKSDVKVTKDLMVLGFKVLLVMVATLIIMVGLAFIQIWFDKNESYNNLIEKVDSLQAQFQIQERNRYYEERLNEVIKQVAQPLQAPQKAKY